MNSKNKIYIFERIENRDTIEDKDIYRHFDAGEYSIEHIMPQHLTPTWIKSLGDDYEQIHETWLHRIANLTLTGYNSKYSNNDFSEKRTIKHGFSESGLRMNQWIANQTQWTLSELEQRSSDMEELCLKIWPIPTTTYKPAEKQMDYVSLDEDIDLSGRDIVKFAFGGTEQPVISWIDMFERVIKILYAEDKAVLIKLAYASSDENELGSFVNKNQQELRSALQIDTNLYVERNTSTPTKIVVLKRLFKEYHIEPEKLVFYLRNGEDTASHDEAGSRYELRRRYWTFALEYIHREHENGGIYHNVSRSKENWLSGFVGISGVSVSCVANYDSARVEYVFGTSSKEKNKQMFDRLSVHKQAIEEALGVQLNWRRLDDVKVSTVTYILPDVSITNESDWVRMAKFHAKWSRKFFDVITPYLKQ